jgi:hypothetical protein
MQSNLVGRRITAYPANDENAIGTLNYHMRDDLTPLAGVSFTIHTTALSEGEPHFWASETKPLGRKSPRVLNGFVSSIGMLYRLLPERSS